MAIECIVAAESIQFTRSKMDVDISKPSDSTLLLSEIVQNWITLRGFSYASSILEAYKCAKRVCYCQRKGSTKGITVFKYRVKQVHIMNACMQHCKVMYCCVRGAVRLSPLIFEACFGTIIK